LMWLLTWRQRIEHFVCRWMSIHHFMLFFWKLLVLELATLI
jgi:hypothetical protein